MILMFGEKGFKQHILLGTHPFLSASHPFLCNCVGIFLSPIFPFVCLFDCNLMRDMSRGGVLPPPNFLYVFFLDIFKGIWKVCFLLVAWLRWIYICCFYIFLSLICGRSGICPSEVKICFSEVV